VAKLNPAKGRAQWSKVLNLIRDIANPSLDDDWFPLWRHKDWFLGSSWASGIVKHEWGPDPHGRNQVCGS
jgi:endo-1,3(4)-beta-glucanase